MASTEYLEALNAANAASKAFSQVQQAYRARTIGDAEYVAARKVHDAAAAAFDLAYAVEESREV